jgi:hypothetical protein
MCYFIDFIMCEELSLLSTILSYLRGAMLQVLTSISKGRTKALKKHQRLIIPKQLNKDLQIETSPYRKVSLVCITNHITWHEIPNINLERFQTTVSYTTRPT